MCFYLRVWEENPVFHWDILFAVGRGFEKVAGKETHKIRCYKEYIIVLVPEF